MHYKNNGSKFSSSSSRLLMKTHRSPFENLRANGAPRKMLEYFPLVLSWSKHSERFSATCECYAKASDVWLR